MSTDWSVEQDCPIEHKLVSEWVVCVHAWRSALCMHPCVWVCVHLCKQAYMRVHVCACMRVCMCMCVVRENNCKEITHKVLERQQSKNKITSKTPTVLIWLSDGIIEIWNKRHFIYAAFQRTLCPVRLLNSLQLSYCIWFVCCLEDWWLKFSLAETQWV